MSLDISPPSSWLFQEKDIAVDQHGIAWIAKAKECFQEEDWGMDLGTPLTPHSDVDRPEVNKKAWIIGAESC